VSQICLKVAKTTGDEGRPIVPAQHRHHSVLEIRA
jgi:hypothetical protein